MIRDHLTVLIALAVLAVSLIGAGYLQERINEQRVDLELALTDDLMENLPPELALTQAGLGSFRGVAIDLLWARASRMEQEGQYWEALQLAEWITRLQPHFPRVWAFRAWNMSYNIAAAAQTPEERYLWVRSGIRLLQEQAIPRNPDSLRLYKELAWMLLHRLGGDSDEMHWYHKRRWAEEWEGVLGVPPAGDPARTLSWFQPVAEAQARFVNRTWPGRELRLGLDRLAAEAPTLGPQLRDLSRLTLPQLQVRLRRLLREQETQRPALAARLTGLLDEVSIAVTQARRDPWDRLLEEVPDVRRLRKELEGIGVSADAGLLPRLAALEAGVTEEPLASWVQAREQDPVWLQLVAFLKACALVERYRMDADLMYELMEGDWCAPQAERTALREAGDIPILPLDWRHPAAHALYWAAAGLRRVRDPGGQFVLNTDRLALYSLASLTRGGQVVHDRRTGAYRQLADPRFIDAYLLAAYGARERLGAEDTEEIPEGLQIGHHNFLRWATRTAYLYGQEQQADRYYRELRRLYAPPGSDAYTLPLRDFVLTTFLDDASLDSLEEARVALGGLLRQGLVEGLVANRQDTSRRFLQLARELHRRYQDRHAGGIPGVRGRTQLPPFDTMLADALTAYLEEQARGASLPLLIQVWSRTPVDLQRAVWPRLAAVLEHRAVEAGLDPTRAFPR